MSINPDEVETRNIHLRSIISESESADLIRAAEDLGNWFDALRRKDEADQVGTLMREDWDASLILERDNQAIFSAVRAKVEDSLNVLLKRKPGDEVLLERFVLLKYGVGGHLYEHVDASPTYNRHRRYSVVLYLNDEYSGGATSFPTIGKEFRGKTGQALIFPAGYRHRGEPVKDGTKYVLVSFICDPASTPVGA